MKKMQMLLWQVREGDKKMSAYVVNDATISVLVDGFINYCGLDIPFYQSRGWLIDVYQERQENRALITNGKIRDVIYGDFFLCGIGEEDFTDMPDDLIDKYKELMDTSLVVSSFM